MHRVRVPLGFAPFVSEALLRLRYLHPDVSAEQVGDEITCNVPSGVDPAHIERELSYLLYRAKIHAEGQPRRAALARMAFGA